MDSKSTEAVNIASSDTARFYKKVDKTSDCWLWTASTRGKTGYGAFKIQGKVVDAHRLSYQIHKGQIADGMLVCHTCDNRLCVNPDHLWLGTYQDNWIDALQKGRAKAPDNKHRIKHPSISQYRKGCRCEECKECKRQYDREYKLRDPLAE
jgi:hypothetical protein